MSEASRIGGRLREPPTAGYQYADCDATKIVKHPRLLKHLPPPSAPSRELE